MTKLEMLLKDFVFWDCRLGSHPRVRSMVSIRNGDQLQPTAQTGHIGMPRSISLATRKNGFTGILVPSDNYRYAEVRESPQAFLAVPIRSGTEVAGVISLTTSEEVQFDERRVAEATTLSAIVAYAMFHLETRERRPTQLPRELGKALKCIREDLGLTQKELADRSGTTRIALSRWEAGSQPPTFGPLKRWCTALGVLSSDSPTIVTLSDISPGLLHMLSEEPSRLRELAPEGFEILVAERLDKAGFEVQRTGSIYAKDGGIDLVAIPRVAGLAGQLIAVQVKHHRADRKTGRVAVDRLLSWQGGVFNAGLLVTNTGFTRDAVWAATQPSNRIFLRLRDLEDLRRWMQSAFWSEEEWRELPEQVDLAPGVSIKISRPRLERVLEVWPVRKLEPPNDA